jgi:hypothetical protein
MRVEGILFLISPVGCDKKIGFIQIVGEEIEHFEFPLCFPALKVIDPVPGSQVGQDSGLVSGLAKRKSLFGLSSKPLALWFPMTKSRSARKSKIGRAHV